MCIYIYICTYIHIYTYTLHIMICISISIIILMGCLLHANVLSVSPKQYGSLRVLSLPSSTPPAAEDPDDRRDHIEVYVLYSWFDISCFDIILYHIILYPPFRFGGSPRSRRTCETTRGFLLLLLLIIIIIILIIIIIIQTDNLCLHDESLKFGWLLCDTL